MKSFAIFKHLVSEDYIWSNSRSNHENFLQVLESSRLTGKPIFFVNSYSCFLANRSEEYEATLTDGLCLIDGKPLARLISRSKKTIVKQVRGMDFFSAALTYFANAGKRQFLLGATEETCKLIIQKLKPSEAGSINYFCPPLVSAEHFDYATALEKIKAHKPDLVWVALGTPKQDIVAHRIARNLESCSVAAVGAAFDFYSGQKKQAPKWMQLIYLEWLFRFLDEPRRLWKRYLVGNVGFLMDTLVWRLIKSRLNK